MMKPRLTACKPKHRLAILGSLLMATWLPVTAVANQPLAGLALDHEPGPGAPWGSPDEQADPRLGEYAFMIGDWACQDRKRGNDQQWAEDEVKVRATYFLNGHAIINYTYSRDDASSMVYQLDPKQENWIITNYSAPQFSRTEWSGRKENKNMLATTTRTLPNGNPLELKILFSDITKKSFAWSLAAVTPNGERLIRERKCARLGGPVSAANS